MYTLLSKEIELDNEGYPISKPKKLFKKVFDISIMLQIEVRGSEKEISKAIEKTDLIDFGATLEDVIWEEVDEPNYTFTVSAIHSDTTIINDDRDLEEIE